MDQINGLSSGTRSAFLSLFCVLCVLVRWPWNAFLCFLFCRFCLKREREREKKDARFRKGLRRIKLTYEIGEKKKRKRHTHSTVERARTLPWGGPVVTPLNWARLSLRFLFRFPSFDLILSSYLSGLSSRSLPTRKKKKKKSRHISATSSSIRLFRWKLEEDNRYPFSPIYLVPFFFYRALCAR